MSHHNPASSEVTDEPPECVQKRTVTLMELPNEILDEIFSHVDTLQDVGSLRATCQHFNEIYEFGKEKILLNVREALVRPIREYYEFLESMMIPTGSIRYPPVSGWANMTGKACKGFKKIPFAIDVLRHLPFIYETSTFGNLSARNFRNIGPRSFVVDYSIFKSRDFIAYNTFSGNNVDENAGSQRHLITIMECAGCGGTKVIINTFTGIISEIKIDHNPTPDQWGHSTRSRRGGLVAITRRHDPVKEYFRSQINRRKQLDEMFVGRGRWMGRGDLNYDAVANLYRCFGWLRPEWKKEECMQAIAYYLTPRRAAP